MLPLVLSSLLSVVPAQADKIEFPKTDQPANFSFAAGSYDNLTVRAAPTTVQVEEPITLTVTIASLVPGPFAHPPRRDTLLLFPPEFDNDFFVEEVPEQDRFLADENAWEFAYRVLPRRVDVKAIPALQFVYFRTVGERKYQAVASSEIPIEVKPRPTVQMGAPAPLRARLQSSSVGHAFFALDGPGLLWTILAFAVPPVLCVAGVTLWQRCFPDAAARARLRRGRAFRRAMKQLRRLGGRASAAAVAGVLVEYLRSRLDLATAEPTPLEVKMALLTAGLPEDLALSVEGFCHACDAERFAPAGAGASDHFAVEATQLLQTIEKTATASRGRQPPENSAASRGRQPPETGDAWLTVVLLCLTLTSFFPEDAAASEGDDWFQQGIASEQDSTAARQAYARAARHYQQLVDSGQHDPDLFRQLGDAYLLADNLPHAVLAYRRGLKEAPHLQALSDHLEAARDRVPYPNGDERHRPPPSDWPAWLPRPSPGLLLLTAAALHAWAWLALTWWWLRRQTSSLVWATLLLTAVLGVLGWWGYGEWTRAKDGQRAFVVVAYNNMTLRRGNGTMFAPSAELPVVHGGMEARWLRERGGWVQVEFPGGEVGWLPRRALLLD